MRGIIGALVRPHRKDGVGIRANNSVCRWQAHADPIGVMTPGANEIEAPIGIDIHAVKGLVIQREGERQADKRRAVVAMIASIDGTRHDRVGPLRDDIILGRATLDVIISREGRITIASFSSDRVGPNARCHAASEIEMHREVDSRI